MKKSEKMVKRYVNMDLSSRQKTNMDRIREHIFSGGTKPLAPREQEKYRKLRVVNQYICQVNTTQETVNLIIAELGCNEASAYLLIRESKALFGDINKADKIGQRYVLTEMYMVAAKGAMEAKDWQTYIHALDSIAKINGLTAEEVHRINMQNLVMPNIVMMDSNLDTLRLEMEKMSGNFPIAENVEYTDE